MPVLILLFLLPKLITIVQDIIIKQRQKESEQPLTPEGEEAAPQTIIPTEKEQPLTPEGEAAAPTVIPTEKEQPLPLDQDGENSEELIRSESKDEPTPNRVEPEKVDYYHPGKGEGKMLDSSGGLGEPLNVIISGKSSPEVLTDAGFLNWAKSIGFSREFLGLHRGTLQMADLGDGNGSKPEIKVIRQDYGIPFIGTGIESIIGGNHFRYWRQDGAAANSGALFLAVSHEENVFKHHMIKANGYNKGRDELVTRAVGKTKYGGIRYSTTHDVAEGLLPTGATGINHNIAIDGKIALLTITVIS